jgi:hypothetical protein
MNRRRAVVPPERRAVLPIAEVFLEAAHADLLRRARGGHGLEPRRRDRLAFGVDHVDHEQRPPGVPIALIDGRLESIRQLQRLGDVDLGRQARVARRTAAELVEDAARLLHRRGEREEAAVVEAAVDIARRDLGVGCAAFGVTQEPREDDGLADRRRVRALEALVVDRADAGVVVRRAEAFEADLQVLRGLALIEHEIVEARITCHLHVPLDRLLAFPLGTRRVAGGEVGEMTGGQIRRRRRDRPRRGRRQGVGRRERPVGVGAATVARGERDGAALPRQLRRSGEDREAGAFGVRLHLRLTGAELRLAVRGLHRDGCVARQRAEVSPQLAADELGVGREGLLRRLLARIAEHHDEGLFPELDARLVPEDDLCAGAIAGGHLVAAVQPLVRLTELRSRVLDGDTVAHEAELGVRSRERGGLVGRREEQHLAWLEVVGNRPQFIELMQQIDATPIAVDALGEPLTGVAFDDHVAGELALGRRSLGRGDPLAPNQRARHAPADERRTKQDP